jgi:hypothetical protein
MSRLGNRHRRIFGLHLTIILAFVAVLVLAGCGHGNGGY